MKNKLYVIFLLFSWICFFSLAQSQPAERIFTRQEYIDAYKDEAVKEMLRTGIPASITLAQGILESGDGNSPLARYAKNHFGIKCHNWTGPTFIQDDDTKNECFRKYQDPYQSYQDHSEFLTTRSRYAFLFELSSTDYKAWAHGLKRAGYATNPKYPELLIKIIEENNLHVFDKLDKVPVKNVKSNSEKSISKETIPYKTKEILMESSYEVFKHENGIPYIIAKKGDTPDKIAKKLDLGHWEIKKYNDLSQGESIKEDQVIYIKPKKKQSKKYSLHTVHEGDTWWSISQKYGIKLKHLKKYNSELIHQELKVGTKVSLKKQ